MKSSTTIAERIFKPFLQFSRLESASGLLLFFVAAGAFLWANSPLRQSYSIFSSALGHPVNEGLMALFFLLMGLEIKREMVSGELTSFQKSALPVAAALGGMMIPAGIYALFNHGSPAASGWGIPMATDIAFVLGALTLLGKRIPVGLKVFLVALAIIDDIGAILVIALFYTQQIQLVPLALAGACLIALLLLNAVGVRRLPIYLIVGVLLWLLLLRSGIHSTLSGVALAFFIPLGSQHSKASPLQQLEHRLHPWASFVILPLFALVNAGVALSPETRGLLWEPAGLGILAGLCLGKPLGILSFSWLAVKLKVGALPHGVNWKQLFGAGILGGIGFTMSLFIADLGLNPGLLEGAKLSILCASLIAGSIGFGYLWVAGRNKTSRY